MIRVLEKKIADKIAAGEVVERPLSIIKELVENSIDAGSSKITVEIKNGGKSYIRITDNGCGIDENEVDIAFVRHATSKIFDEEDLNRIGTLGFRGEALASIAAVSRVEMITKTEDGSVGRKILIYGGETVENSPIGAPNGTTVIVRDLFYNTPARLKFLKSDKAESSKIIEFITNMTLAYPNIKFMLINNDKILFSTNGKGNRMQVIATVTSNKEIENLIGFNYEQDSITVNGYTSKPSYSKATRKDQIFFVNGRVVDSKIIEKGINIAYGDRLFEGRFPICYLFIDVDLERVDVNIHPNKTQIRFFDEERVVETVAKGLISALNSKEALTVAHSSSGQGGLQVGYGIGNKQGNKAAENRFQILASDQNSVEDAVNTFDTVNTLQENTDKKTDLAYNNSKKEEQHSSVRESLKEVDLSEKEFIQVEEILKGYRQEEKSRIQKEKDTSIQTEILNGFKKKNRFDFSNMEIIGQFFGTYIQLKDENSIYFIDQHAAHERVYFEKFLNNYNSSQKNKQVILFPILINGDYRHKELESIWMEILDKLGFTVEEFGVNIYRVTEIPMFLKIDEADRFLSDFMDSINEYGDFSKKDTIDKIATKACKAAIKANDILKTEEISQLLIDMSKCENPFSCPHGRPTFIKMTKNDMEKRFKRT